MPISPIKCKQVIASPAKPGEEIGGEAFLITERDIVVGGEKFLVHKLFEIIRKANDLGLNGKQITEIRLNEDTKLAFKNQILEVDWKRKP